MADKLPFGEGASINRTPLFCGVNYQFWKIRMNFFVELTDKGIWDAIENGHFIPKTKKDDVFVDKPWFEWTEPDSKKAKFHWIAKNIITFALSFDELSSVSSNSSINAENYSQLDGYPLGEDFINEGRGFSPTHLKFFLLVFSQIKRSQREDQA